jgi:hypothetical protein
LSANVTFIREPRTGRTPRARNFLDLDDVPVGEEGEPVDPT